MKIRPLRADDLTKTDIETFGCTLRGLVVDDDGVPIAFGGVLHTQPLQAISQLEDGIRKSPKMIVKLAKAVTALFEKYNAPIYAVADRKEKSAEQFLTFLGFEPYASTEHGEVFVWPKH